MQVDFFADASEGAYGVVAYLRIYDTYGKVSCNFLIGKVRLSLIKSTSVPKPELEAATVRKVLGQCSQCKKSNALTENQFMSELPKCRLTPYKPQFYFTGVDYFGPFFVKQARSYVKRWGCIFTCLTTGAMRIEVAPTLSTDSFITALRKFIRRRGKPFELQYIVIMGQILLVQKENFVKLYRNLIRP